MSVMVDRGHGVDLLMLFSRHVYSSWYFLHSCASAAAFSSPKWLASRFAMDSVERSVPYASKARIISFVAMVYL